MSTRILRGIVALGLGVVLGCGGSSKTYRVEGIVTLDGKPLEGVTVKFLPDEGSSGQTAVGTTGSDGSFRLQTNAPGDGAMAGTYRVVVIKEETVAVSGGPPGAASIEDKRKFYMSQVKTPAVAGKAKKGQLPPVYGDPSNNALEKVKVPTNGPVRLELKSTAT